KISKEKSFFVVVKHCTSTRFLEHLIGMGLVIFLSLIWVVHYSRGGTKLVIFKESKIFFAYKIEGWKSKMLPPSSRLVLKKHVFSSIPTHIPCFLGSIKESSVIPRAHNG
ncbi:hypothetical protein ACH5RR_023357, partial [Cinchona calisaya]